MDQELTSIWRPDPAELGRRIFPWHCSTASASLREEQGLKTLLALKVQETFDVEKKVVLPLRKTHIVPYVRHGPQHMGLPFPRT